jgi:hypothetical protein
LSKGWKGSRKGNEVKVQERNIERARWLKGRKKRDLERV